MSDLKRYYNLRFPKNGRYPTFMDMIALYPYMGNIVSWDEVVNISDVDFIEHLSSGVKIVDIENSESMSGFPPKKPEINVIGATLANPSIGVYNEDLPGTKPDGWKSVLQTMDSNSVADTKVPESVSVKTNSGTANVFSDDFVFAYSDGTRYNYLDMNMGGKQCVCYFGAEVSTNYFMNRCFATLVNPLQYSNKDKSGQLSSDRNGISYDYNKLPLDATRTNAKTPDMFTSFRLDVPVKVIEVTGTMRLSPQTFVISAYGTGTAFGGEVELDEGYTLHYDIRLLDEILYEGNKIMSSSGTVKIDMTRDFPNITSYYDYLYTMHFTLRYGNDPTDLEGPVVVSTFIDAPYTEYRIEVTDEEDNIVEKFEATNDEVLPAPMFVRLYGSNKFVTDINLCNENYSLTVAAYNQTSSSPIGNYVPTITDIYNNAFRIDNIKSTFGSYVSKWTSVSYVQFTGLDVSAGNMMLTQSEYYVDDITPVVGYAIITDMIDITAFNRSEIYPTTFIVTLRAILESGNIVEKASSTHNITLTLYNYEGEIIGNVIRNRSFLDSAKISISLSNFSSDILNWNWFNVEKMEITLNGEDVSDSNRVIVVSFFRQPNNTAVLYTEMTTETTEVIQTKNEDNEVTLTPDIIDFNVKEWIEDVEYTEPMYLTLSVELYRDITTTDEYYMRSLVEITDFSDISVNLTESFPSVDWERINLIRFILLDSLKGDRHYESVCEIPVIHKEPEDSEEPEEPDDTDSEENNEDEENKNTDTGDDQNNIDD